MDSDGFFASCCRCHADLLVKIEYTAGWPCVTLTVGDSKPIDGMLLCPRCEDEYHKMKQERQDDWDYLVAAWRAGGGVEDG